MVSKSIQYIYIHFKTSLFSNNILKSVGKGLSRSEQQIQAVFSLYSNNYSVSIRFNRRVVSPLPLLPWFHSNCLFPISAPPIASQAANQTRPFVCVYRPAINQNSAGQSTHSRAWREIARAAVRFDNPLCKLTDVQFMFQKPKKFYWLQIVPKLYYHWEGSELKCFKFIKTCGIIGIRNQKK